MAIAIKEGDKVIALPSVVNVCVSKSAINRVHTVIYVCKYLDNITGELSTELTIKDDKTGKIWYVNLDDIKPFYGYQLEFTFMKE